MRARYFFDAYGLIRLAESRPSYERFRDAGVVTQTGHVLEFVAYLMKAHRTRDVRTMLAGLRAERLDPTDDDLIEVVKLKRSRPKLSTQDALGYVLARREGLRFLTGDSAFRGMAGVEFVE